MTFSDDDETEEALVAMGSLAPLVDLTTLSMDSLLHVENEALNLCLQRLLRDINDPNGVISAFGNAP